MDRHRDTKFVVDMICSLHVRDIMQYGKRDALYTVSWWMNVFDLEDSSSWNGLEQLIVSTLLLRDGSSLTYYDVMSSEVELKSPLLP